MYFHDCVERKIRVHVIHQTGDKLAVNKQARLVGQNGRCPYIFCVFAGVRILFHHHMYYPTKCTGFVPPEDDLTDFRISEEGSRAPTEFWDPRRRSYRTAEGTALTLSKLKDPYISNA